MCDQAYLNVPPYYKFKIPYRYNSISLACAQLLDLENKQVKSTYDHSATTPQGDTFMLDLEGKELAPFRCEFRLFLIFDQHNDLLEGFRSKDGWFTCFTTLNKWLCLSALIEICFGLGGIEQDGVRVFLEMIDNDDNDDDPSNVANFLVTQITGWVEPTNSKIDKELRASEIVGTKMAMEATPLLKEGSVGFLASVCIQCEGKLLSPANGMDDLPNDCHRDARIVKFRLLENRQRIRVVVLHQFSVHDAINDDMFCFFSFSLSLVYQSISPSFWQ